MVTLQHVSARSQQLVGVLTRLATRLLPCLELAPKLPDATNALRQPTAMTLKDTDGEETRGQRSAKKTPSMTLNEGGRNRTAALHAQAKNVPNATLDDDYRMHATTLQP